MIKPPINPLLGCVLCTAGSDPICQECLAHTVSNYPTLLDRRPFNISVLRAVQTRILNDPEHFIMSSWTNDCGTSACIAGWIMKDAGVKVGQELDSYPEAALSLLGLPYGSDSIRLSYSQLFYAGHWPQPFRELWHNNLEDFEDDPLDRVLASRIAAAAIEYYIAVWAQDVPKPE